MGGVGSGSGDAEGSRSNASIVEMVASKALTVCLRETLASNPLLSRLEGVEIRNDNPRSSQLIDALGWNHIPFAVVVVRVGREAAHGGDHGS